MKFTISIPTFNRKDLLIRSLNYLESIQFDKTKFEIIIVDDGSTDNTAACIREFKETSELQIQYIYQANGGKYTALGKAIRLAKGDFFINTDSDDYLDKDCLSNFLKIWESESLNDLPNIAGIIGHNGDISSKNLVGDLFPEDIKYSDPIDMRFKYKVSGDKIPMFKTSILKEYNFPEKIDNLKFIPESYIFYGISKKHKFYYSNKIYQYCFYQKEGLSNNIKDYRYNNSLGPFLVYERYILNYTIKKSFRGYCRNYINYVCFGIISRKYSKIKIRSLLDCLLWILGFSLFVKRKYENR